MMVKQTIRLGRIAFGLVLTLMPNIYSTIICRNVFATAEKIIPKTGSWQNCTSLSENQRIQRRTEKHPDSSFTTISCEKVHYRIPKILRTTSSDVVIGILSAAAGDGPTRRKSIRSTWGYRKEYVFFIVAGSWKDIAEEYQEHMDLLWIDKEEIYVTETSVLTLKTETFFSVMYSLVMQNNENDSGPSYLFKTDDDSYVNIKKLHKALLDETRERISSLDYWGKCNSGGWKPHRNQEIEWQKKWYISYETYPEKEYPPFCQGAGFALSRKFLDCAIGQGHVARVRYMPNEDVAIGLLAERCGIQNTDDDRVWIRFKGDTLTMENKIIQHYVKSEDHMRLHHRSATGARGPEIPR